MIVYPDSSFLVSRYLSDLHSTEVDRRMAQHPSVILTPFHQAEVANAIFQQAFRGKLLLGEVHLAYDDFELDWEMGVWVLVSQPESAYARSVALAKTHVATLGIRTLDTLHVAAALELKATHFWTFDERQARLAEAEGLAVN